MCDEEMQALNFLNDWFGKIYKPNGKGLNRGYQLNYPEEYRCTEMIVEKRERNNKSEIGKKDDSMKSLTT